MNKLITAVEPWVGERFNNIEALSSAECRGSIMYLEYLLIKEKKPHLQEKYRHYIGRLNFRLTELKEK